MIHQVQGCEIEWIGEAGPEFPSYNKKQLTMMVFQNPESLNDILWPFWSGAA